MFYTLSKTNILIIFVMFLKFSSSTLVGICNKCLSSNNVTCINENQFSICVNGLPTAMITSCPRNSVCTDDIQICRSPEEGFAPICYQDYCGNCDITNGVFSCMDETTYAYCFGENFPNEGSRRSCPEGYVCNSNFPEICVSASMNEPTCLPKTTTTETTEISTDHTTDDFTTEITTYSTSDTASETNTQTTTDTTTKITIDSTTTEITADSTTETTSEITTDSTSEKSTDSTTDKTEIATDSTTVVTSEITTDSTTKITTDSTTKVIPEVTSAPRHPNDICEEIGELGYFKSDDPTCRQYIYCYSLSGQYLGWFYYCDGYFNAETQKCQTGRPVDCVEY